MKPIPTYLNHHSYILSTHNYLSWVLFAKHWALFVLEKIYFLESVASQTCLWNSKSVKARVCTQWFAHNAPVSRKDPIGWRLGSPRCEPNFELWLCWLCIRHTVGENNNYETWLTSDRSNLQTCNWKTTQMHTFYW